MTWHGCLSVLLVFHLYFFENITAQKIKFSINDFFSKCDQIRSFQRIWSLLLRKSLMENIIFCAVHLAQQNHKCHLQQTWRIGLTHILTWFKYLNEARAWLQFSRKTLYKWKLSAKTTTISYNCTIIVVLFNISLHNWTA